MRRLRFGAFILLVAAIGLAGCGDPEADQRKAFTDFLQTRILDKPGIHVPQLTEEHRKAFGPYAEHYGVIATFHTGMNGSVSPKLNAAMAGGAITSIGDLTARRRDLETAKTTLTAMSDALGAEIAQADAAHAKLAQPAELKVVYDKAYERLVTAPAAVMKGVVPVADAVFAKALALADFVEQNKAKLKISGSTLQVSDRKLQDDLNAKLQDLQASQRAVQEAQGRVRTMVYGP